MTVIVDARGGKCLRALKNREDAFSIYGKGRVELVGMTTCDGCPCGNIEYAGDEMVKNGASVIHLATGMVVGYPPCPNIAVFRDFFEKRYGVRVITGTHPIPRKYLDMHNSLGTWNSDWWRSVIAPVMSSEETRAQYD